jgi:hypothetical protein
MAKSRKQLVTLEAIRNELRTAAERFLCGMEKDHPGERLYGFFFELSREGDLARGAAATDEGLSRFAEERLAQDGGNLDKLRAELRWGSTEEAWYQAPGSAFIKVNKLLRQAEQQGLYEMYDGTLNGLCLDVLKEMDTAGAFGAGPDRERVVVGLCYIGGGRKAEFLEWAKQVNSSKVVKRLERELKQ